MSERKRDANGDFRTFYTSSNEPNYELHARHGENIIAVCAPFVPGYGFFAVLVVCNGMYRLYSYDTQQDFSLDAHSFDPLVPTLRADCVCSDYRPAASVKTSAQIATELCMFWQHYASEGSNDMVRTRSNDHRFTAECNADWWARFGDQLTGQDDNEMPIDWVDATRDDDDDDGPGRIFEE